MTMIVNTQLPWTAAAKSVTAPVCVLGDRMINGYQDALASEVCT